MSGFLVQSRYQEVAQFLTEIVTYGDPQKRLGQALGTFGSFGADYQQSVIGLFGTLPTWDPAFGDPGAWNSAAILAQEVWALTWLVQEARVSPQEAQAFLRQKYPGYSWSSGHWQDFSQSAGEALAQSLESAAAPGDPEAPSASDKAQVVAQSAAQGTLSAIQELPVATPSIEDLPDEYDAEAIVHALESLGSQLALNDQALHRGAISLPAGSLDGGAIAPGTLPPTAMQPVAWSSLLSQLPGPESALGIVASLAPNVDRSYSAGGLTGPGRVRTVQRLSVPAGWLPYRGVHRYRVAGAGSRFGVMGLLLDPSTWSGSTPPIVRPTWGYVLHRIPHYLGRPPAGLAAVEFVGEAPVPFGYQFVDPGGGSMAGTPRLFHDRAKADFQDATKTWAVALGSDAMLDPTASDLANMQGIVVSLITGTTAEEVYQQLNTRVPLAGAGIRSSGHGPSRSSPEGLEIQAPTTSSVLRYNGTTYDHLTPASAVASESRLVQGMPFSYEDCAKMVPNDTHFDVVVQAVGDVAHDGTGLTWPTLASWYDHGFRLATGDDRVVQIDALIF